MSGKCLSNGSFYIIYLFTAETLPTEVRNIGVSTASTSARIGSLLAPFIALMVSQFDCNSFIHKVLIATEHAYYFIMCYAWVTWIL